MFALLTSNFAVVKKKKKRNKVFVMSAICGFAVPKIMMVLLSKRLSGLPYAVDQTLTVNNNALFWILNLV